jgi:hypothetical protein
VVEVADEHGEYCGRVLAALGADVVKVADGCTASGTQHTHRGACRAVSGPEVALVANPGGPPAAVPSRSWARSEDS